MTTKPKPKLPRELTAPLIELDRSSVLHAGKSDYVFWMDWGADLYQQKILKLPTLARHHGIPTDKPDWEISLLLALIDEIPGFRLKPKPSRARPTKKSMEQKRGESRAILEAVTVKLGGGTNAFGGSVLKACTTITKDRKSKFFGWNPNTLRVRYHEIVADGAVSWVSPNHYPPGLARLLNSTALDKLRNIRDGGGDITVYGKHEAFPLAVASASTTKGVEVLYPFSRECISAIAVGAEDNAVAIISEPGDNLAAMYLDALKNTGITAVRIDVLDGGIFDASPLRELALPCLVVLRDDIPKHLLKMPALSAPTPA